MKRNLKNFLNMYRSLHGVHITLGDFWPQFAEFMWGNECDRQGFTKDMTIDTAIFYAENYYDYKVL